MKRWPIADLFFNHIEGLVVDLMDEISTIGGFNYSLYFTPDDKYGYVENGRVNGMIGEVYNNVSKKLFARLKLRSYSVN